MSILTKLFDWVQSGLIHLVNLLPDSPFNFDIPQSVKVILGYINYFVPISTFIKILTAWTACILLWYVISALARWLKMVQ